jgi:5'(3')-deoxyribonucleotidase
MFRRLCFELWPTSSWYRIAVDMNEVIADTVSAWLARHQQEFAIALAPAALRGRKVVDAVDPGHAMAL